MKGLILIPLLCALRQSKAAANITPGFDVFVHEVMAAITTDPWFISHSAPLKLNLAVSPKLLGLSPNPLKPTALVKDEFQSFFKSFSPT